MTPKILQSPNPVQPIDEIQLIQQVGEWAERNFKDKREPEWGFIEELGEACHCRLKHFQKIRGFEDRNYFINELTDAFADMIIYLADWCCIHQSFFKFARNGITPARLTLEDERKIITHLLQGASQLTAFDIMQPGQKIEPAEVGTYVGIAQRLCNGVEFWAQVYDINLSLAVAATWAKVTKRNWLDYPINAPDKVN